MRFRHIHRELHDRRPFSTCYIRFYTVAPLNSEYLEALETRSVYIPFPISINVMQFTKLLFMF